MKSQTKETFKKLGLHTQNFIEVTVPCFMYDLDKKKICMGTADHEECVNGKAYSLESCKLSENWTHDDAHLLMINNAKRIAWMPMPEDSEHYKLNVLRLAILG